MWKEIKNIIRKVAKSTVIQIKVFHLISIELYFLQNTFVKFNDCQMWEVLYAVNPGHLHTVTWRLSDLLLWINNLSSFLANFSDEKGNKAVKQSWRCWRIAEQIRTSSALYFDSFYSFTVVILSLNYQGIAMNDHIYRMVKKSNSNIWPNQTIVSDQSILTILLCQPMNYICILTAAAWYSGLQLLPSYIWLLTETEKLIWNGPGNSMNSSEFSTVLWLASKKFKSTLKMWK